MTASDDEIPAFVLVDDDEDDRYFMREAVRYAGDRYKVEEFTTGQQFLDYLSRELAQKGGKKVLWLVILDLNLPDISGEYILQVMKQHPVWQQVPVIILSGQEGIDQGKKILSLGAADYIVKPSNIEELVNHIHDTFAPWLSRPVNISTSF